MNAYFLIAGLLLLLLSAAHALWGERRVFTVLTPSSTDAETYMSTYVPWHQLTGLLFLAAIALLGSAFLPEPGLLPIFILAVITSNLLIFFGLIMVKRQQQMFARTLPQTVLFLLLVALIVMGIITTP